MDLTGGSEVPRAIELNFRSFDAIRAADTNHDGQLNSTEAQGLLETGPTIGLSTQDFAAVKAIAEDPSASATLKFRVNGANSGTRTIDYSDQSQRDNYTAAELHVHLDLLAMDPGQLPVGGASQQDAADCVTALLCDPRVDPGVKSEIFGRIEADPALRARLLDRLDQDQLELLYAAARDCPPAPRREALTGLMNDITLALRAKGASPPTGPVVSPPPPSPVAPRVEVVLPLGMKPKAAAPAVEVVYPQQRNMPSVPSVPSQPSPPPAEPCRVGTGWVQPSE